MYKLKLFIARMQVARFTNTKNINNLATPLACFRSLRELIFVEPKKLRVYFK